MEAGEQPIEKVHLLGQQGRSRGHQPAALREGGPVSASLLCGEHGRLKNHQLLNVCAAAELVRLQEGHPSGPGRSA